jgi:hypothetical protein
VEENRAEEHQSVKSKKSTVKKSIPQANNIFQRPSTLSLDDGISIPLGLPVVSSTPPPHAPHKALRPSGINLFLLHLLLQLQQRRLKS